MANIKKWGVSGVLIMAITTPISAYSNEQEDKDIARGKYLIEIGGCNDCHTSGFASSGGNIPESEWLLGDGLGFRGPWGTTYSSNLRQSVGSLSEAEWLLRAKTLKTRPPMPWWSLNSMTDEDLTALYKYIRGLEVIKTEVPSFVLHGKEPNTPYIQWPTPPKQ